MIELLKICNWNANGLIKHIQEIKHFLVNNDVDILLISETHCTSKSYVKIPQYTIYYTNHPDGTAHGGTAIIIKNNIKHFHSGNYTENHLQATTITIQEKVTTLNISSVYCPPKYNIKKDEFLKFFRTLGNRFMAGGDFNAKHRDWGSRITRTDGRQMMAAIQEHNMNYLTTREPTYWPTDRRKLPDLIDFFVLKGVNIKLCKIESCYELAGDHSAIIVSLSSHIKAAEERPNLCNKYTDWEIFEDKLERYINIKIPLKTPEQIDNAVSNLTKNIQQACWEATPNMGRKQITNRCPPALKEKIAEKRKIRKRWQNTRSPENKKHLNKLTKELTKLMAELRNEGIQNYLEQLTPTEATDYSLWKATKHLKRPQQMNPPIRNEVGEWAKTNRDKAETFMQHLKKVFTPFPNEACQDTTEEIENSLKIPHQMSLPMRKIGLNQVKNVIKHEINPKKAPGFDLITGTVLQKLPLIALKAITQIFNAVITTGYFPNEWKTAKIIMILKPGKSTEEVTSYRPISLLPMLSKVFEKIYIKKLNEIIKSNKLIPDYQFGFRNKHGTIEQVHRVVNQINKDLERKRYCSAVFLDISQAFDKVWHVGLLSKLKKTLPYDMYEVLKSYLHNRHFMVEHQDECTEIQPILAGVPQGSVLGPTLYLLYTADMPTTRVTTVATYADDTTILSSHVDPTIASKNLQMAVDKIQHWQKTWRMRTNEGKSVHITFTNKKGNCPPVNFNSKQLKHSDTVKYLGLHLDRKLNWQKHIFAKRKQLGLQLQKLHWMIGRRSQLSTTNKVLLYKAILKPIWTYGIQLWGTASNSNIAILERFQNKVIRMIVNAPWFVPNTVIASDLNVPSVKKVIQQHSEKYSVRLQVHPNVLANSLMETSPETRRLKRFKPTDLRDRFR